MKKLFIIPAVLLMSTGLAMAEVPGGGTGGGAGGGAGGGMGGGGGAVALPNIAQVSQGAYYLWNSVAVQDASIQQANRRGTTNWATVDQEVAYTKNSVTVQSAHINQGGAIQQQPLFNQTPF